MIMEIELKPKRKAGRMSLSAVAAFFSTISFILAVCLTFLVIDTIQENHMNQQALVSSNRNFQMQQQLIADMKFAQNYTSQLLDITDDLVNLTNNENLQLTQDLLETMLKLEENSSRLREIFEGANYVLHDPTYREVFQFLYNDTTNNNPYVMPTYVCRHFAMDVVNNAFANSIRCAYVWVGFENFTSHAVIAFNTIDMGLVYVEPQTDSVIELFVGSTYLNAKVSEIIVIW
jgi:hypothetical protein